jgi:glycosyltransferase involved in cell wall biosynthesis
MTVDAARYAAAVYDVPGQAAWRVRVGGRYLLALGGVAPDCGTIELLEAHALMVQEQPALADVLLVVAGRPRDVVPDYQAEFADRAGELRTRPVVLPDVEAHELPTLVAAASAVVHLPATSEDNAAALDALAAGVPVVARDLPGVRAVLADAVAYGDTFLSVADALVDVLTDPPEPDAGMALATAWDSEQGPEDVPPEDVVLEDCVVEEQPDRGDGREE